MIIFKSLVTVLDIMLAVIFVSASKDVQTETKTIYAVIIVLMMSNIFLIWR